MPARGLWADYVELADLAEPAYKGYPEIEVFIFNMATKKKVICASQASTKPFAWDLNSSPYKVPFLMATPQQLVQGNSYILAVVEDDGDLCVLDTTKDQVGPALTKARSVNKKAAALMAPGPSWIASWTSNVTYEYSYRASDPDDFIGVAVEGLTVNAKPVPIYLMSTALSPIGNIIVSWTKRVVTVP